MQPVQCLSRRLERETAIHPNVSKNCLLPWKPEVWSKCFTAPLTHFQNVCEPRWWKKGRNGNLYSRQRSKWPGAAQIESKLSGPTTRNLFSKDQTALPTIGISVSSLRSSSQEESRAVLHWWPTVLLQGTKRVSEPSYFGGWYERQSVHRCFTSCFASLCWRGNVW